MTIACPLHVPDPADVRRGKPSLKMSPSGGHRGTRDRAGIGNEISDFPSMSRDMAFVR